MHEQPLKMTPFTYTLPCKRWGIPRKIGTAQLGGLYISLVQSLNQVFGDSDHITKSSITILLESTEMINSLDSLVAHAQNDNELALSYSLFFQMKSGNYTIDISNPNDVHRKIKERNALIRCTPTAQGYKVSDGHTYENLREIIPQLTFYPQ